MADDVNIKSSSKESVAFDLMKTIYTYEKPNDKNRKYWLTLYSQCLKATSGHTLESILKEE